MFTFYPLEMTEILLKGRKTLTHLSSCIQNNSCIQNSVVLLWHIVGQEPAVLAVGAGRMVFLFIFISSIQFSFSNAISLGRRLDILKYCGFGRYYPTVVVSYYRRRARQVLVNRLVGLSLPRNSVNG